ncbi:MAG: hypothetical protein Q9182_002798 [Xanthomendoza sp. 2 TL-2023]
MADALLPKTILCRAVPTFTPTSSPDLDALFTTFRTTVFFPSHLNSLQKSLIYKTKNHHLLTNPDEPATVKIGSEVHPLVPLSRPRDEPSMHKSLNTILDLCQEPKDWVNMVPFLMGLQAAGRTVRSGQFEKIVRKMADKGGLGVVMEMVRRVEGTGMRLGNVGVAREVMWGALTRCIHTGCSEEGVRDGAKFVNTTWEMLSEERHVEKSARGQDGDPKMKPEIVGVVLWMRAARSILLEAGHDANGEVKRAVEMVLALWKTADLTVKEEEEEGWWDANHKLMMWTPVLHAMKMARKVVGPNSALGRDLTNTITLDLEPTVQKAHDIVSRSTAADSSRRGLVFHDALAKTNIG